MEEIEYLINKVNIHNVAFRLKYSVEEIKRRSPHKKELMEKMTDCYEQLLEAYLYFNKLEPIIKGQEKRNFDLETINLKLQAEINQLKETNQRLLENAPL